METFPLTSNGTVTVTEFGLQIHRPLTQEEWIRTMRGLRTIKCAFVAALGDLTNHGREQWGDQFVADQIEQLEFEFSDTSKAIAIGNIPLEVRTAHRLTSEQSYVLATQLNDIPGLREKWAAICAEHGLTAHELKHSILAGQVTRAAEIAASNNHGGGLPNIQAIGLSFTRWTRTVGGPEKILNMPPTDRKKVLEILEPFVVLAARLQSLGD